MPKTAKDIFKSIENSPTGSHKKLRRFKKVKAAKKKAKKKASKKTVLQEFRDEKDLKMSVDEIVNRAALRDRVLPTGKASKQTPQSLADLERSVPASKAAKKKAKKKFKLAPGIKKQIKKTVKRKAK